MRHSKSKPTYIAVGEEKKVSVLTGLAEVRGAVGKTFDVRSSDSPCACRAMAHKEVAKRPRGPSEIQQVAGLEIAENLFGTGGSSACVTL